MVDICISVLGKLAEYTVAPVVRQFGYLINYENNVEHLSQKVICLAARREGILLATDVATRNLETILPEVKEWLDHVNETIVDKETSFEKERLAQATCCSNRWLPNLKIRYSLSRKAKKMAPDVDSLLDMKFDTIACSGLPPEIEFQPTQHFEDSSQLVTNSDQGASSSGTSNTISPPGKGTNIEFESRKSIIRDVMEALKGNQFNPIVICGMGGVGKTTLVGDVVNNAKTEDLFDEYTKAQVSETPDVNKIQAELAEFLGLNLTQGVSEARADKLRKRLSGTKRVLVILDNVWTPLDFWAIGIPCDLKTCTILVTSRNQDIFNQMETRKKFLIDVLPADEAWRLFKNMAGGSIESDSQLKDIAEEVLKECGGLPLAISTLGMALRDKEKSIWNDALRRLRKPFPALRLGMDKKVYEPIKLSYDILEGEVKSCFLLCCLFPESSDILLQDLVIYGIGLGLFQGIDSIEEGRNLVKALVDTLKSCHLLLDIDKEEYVRMHDVVRDVGLYIASDQREERFAVSHRVESNKDVVPEKYTSSALRTGKSSHRNELLLLSCMSKYSSELPATTMFEGMKELKVLDIKRTIISPILSSLPLFENLRALYLEYCDLRSEMVGPVIGRLGTLMILSLRGSQIEQLPDEFKNLSDLRLLDLTGCSVLRSISPGVISSLSRLEELLMWNSFENSAKSWLDELVSLGCLTNLDMFLPSVGNLGNSLLFRKLERFQISIGSMHEKAVVNPTDNYLRLHDVDAIYLLGTGIIELLKKTGTLDIKMRNLSCPLNLALDTECWVNLTDLTLEDCYGLQYLVDMTLMAPLCVFPVLYSLKLKGLRWLEKIYHGELTLGSLQRLRKLTLSDLPALKYVLKIEISQYSSILRNLEELYIQNCKSLEEIVAFEGSEHNEEEANEITFLNLTRLTLRDLPSFIGISKNICKTQFPQLITLDLRILPKFIGLCRNGLAPESGSNDAVQHLLDPEVDFPALRELRICWLDNFKEIWNNQLSPCSFGELRCLIVSNCSKLVHLVPTSMQSKMQQLEMIEVENCPSLEEIFEFRRLSVNEGTQKNKIIESKQTHGFPNLLSIDIIGCNSLRNLLSSSIARSLGQLRSITMHQCHRIEEIITKPEKGDKTEDRIMLPRLEFLKLFSLSSLIAFSRGNYNFDWPSMKTLGIGNCPKMNKFCSGSLSIPRETEIDDNGNIFQELNLSRKKT